jgi:hypothetical protein
MKDFAALYHRIDAATSTRRKSEALQDYLREATGVSPARLSIRRVGGSASEALPIWGPRGGRPGSKTISFCAFAKGCYGGFGNAAYVTGLIGRPMILRWGQR